MCLVTMLPQNLLPTSQTQRRTSPSQKRFSIVSLRVFQMSCRETSPFSLLARRPTIRAFYSMSWSERDCYCGFGVVPEMSTTILLQELRIQALRFMAVISSAMGLRVRLTRTRIVYWLSWKLLRSAMRKMQMLIKMGKAKLTNLLTIFISKNLLLAFNSFARSSITFESQESAMLAPNLRSFWDMQVRLTAKVARLTRHWETRYPQMRRKNMEQGSDLARQAMRSPKRTIIQRKQNTEVREEQTMLVMRLQSYSTILTVFPKFQYSWWLRIRQQRQAKYSKPRLEERKLQTTETNELTTLYEITMAMSQGREKSSGDRNRDMMRLTMKGPDTVRARVSPKNRRQSMNFLVLRETSPRTSCSTDVSLTDLDLRLFNRDREERLSLKASTFISVPWQILLIICGKLQPFIINRYSSTFPPFFSSFNFNQSDSSIFEPESVRVSGRSPTARVGRFRCFIGWRTGERVSRVGLTSKGGIFGP